jgi:hypothetical protein
MTALPGMDKLLFWLGLGAAQSAGSKPIERRNWLCHSLSVCWLRR